MDGHSLLYPAAKNAVISSLSQMPILLLSSTHWQHGCHDFFALSSHIVMFVLLFTQHVAALCVFKHFFDEELFTLCGQNVYFACVL